MTTLKYLMHPPEQDGYSVEASGEAVTRVQLDGGAGRYRQTLFGVSNLVSCNWILDMVEYNYMQAFYRVHKQGALPFLADLIVDDADLQPYECRIMPGSFKLDQQKGHAYFVSAVLEAVPLTDKNANWDEDLIFLIEEFGPEYEAIFTNCENILHTVTNVKLAEHFQ